MSGVEDDRVRDLLESIRPSGPTILPKHSGATRVTYHDAGIPIARPMFKPWQIRNCDSTVPCGLCDHCKRNGLGARYADVVPCMTCGSVRRFDEPACMCRVQFVGSPRRSRATRVICYQHMAIEDPMPPPIGRRCVGCYLQRTIMP